MVKCERFVKCDSNVKEEEDDDILLEDEEDEDEDEAEETEEKEERPIYFEESEWAAGYAEFNRNMRDVAAEFNRGR